MERPDHLFVFTSTYLTYKAERTLKARKIPCRLVNKPRHLSSECGLAVSVAKADGEAARLGFQEAGVEILAEC